MNDQSLGDGFGKGRKMTENSYKTPCGSIHYFVNIIDKQKITLVFLPGLTADHRLFEKQIEYFENKQNVRNNTYEKNNKVHDSSIFD